MKPSSARTFRCAGARWTGEWPWKWSLWPCPAPTSGPLVARAPAAGEVGEPRREGQHHEHADDARGAAVPVEERPVGPLGVGEAVVLGDLGEAVGAAVREPADDTGEHEGEAQHAEDDESGAGASHDATSVVPRISSSRRASSGRAP